MNIPPANKIAWLIIFTISAAALLLILSLASPVNNFDFWNVYFAFYQQQELGTYYDGLFVQNGHNITVPGYIEIFSAWVNGADNRPAAILVWLLGLFCVGIIYQTFSELTFVGSRQKLILALFCPVIIFNPAAAWTYLEGHTEICWLLGLVIVLLSFNLMTKYLRKADNYLYLIAITGLLSVGGFVHSHVFCAWPILILLSYLRNPRAKTALLILCSGITINLLLREWVLRGIRKPDSLAQSPHDLISHLLYVPAYLGNPIANNFWLSVVFGFLILGLFCYLIRWSKLAGSAQGGRDFAIMLGFYAFTNALAALVFRASEAPRSFERYGLFPALFLLSIYLLLLERATLRSRLIPSSFAFIVALLLLVSNKETLVKAIDFQERKNLSALALTNDIDDPSATSFIIGDTNYRIFRAQMIASDLYPFSSNLWYRNFLIGSKLQTKQGLTEVFPVARVSPVHRNPKTSAIDYHLGRDELGIISLDSDRYIRAVGIKTAGFNHQSVQYSGYIASEFKPEKLRHFLVSKH